MSTHRTASFSIVIILLVVFPTLFLLPFVLGASSSTNRWKVTSVKICRTGGGSVYTNMEAIGHYPVYTFFLPRPIWTVNGTVVEAKPVYQNGRLVSFTLFNGTTLLNPGRKNTVKFALPDHNGSRVFLYDHSRIPPGECYEFF